MTRPIENAEWESMKSRLREAMRERDQHNRDKGALMQACNDLEEQLAEANRRIDERDMKIKRMREDLEAERVAAQNSIAERDRELAKANQRIEKLAKYEQQAEILSSRLEKEGISLAEQDAALEAARAENAELRKALVEKTCIIKGLSEDLGSADKLLAEAVEDIDRLEKEVEDARSATGTLNSEHVRQRSRIVDLERQSASYRTAIRQLCAALEWATKAINDLTDVTGEDIPF